MTKTSERTFGKAAMISKNCQVVLRLVTGHALRLPANNSNILTNDYNDGEELTQVRNDDGTFSFHNKDGMWLSADKNGNQTAFHRFWLEPW